jgi:transposase-like protein
MRRSKNLNEPKCNMCGTIGEENGVIYDTIHRYWLCPVCKAKMDAASAPKPKPEVVIEPAAPVYEDPIEEELDAKYFEQLKEQRDRRITEKIERAAALKGRSTKNSERLAHKDPVSKVIGELYCQVCGGTKISKSGYLFNYDEKVQKWKCSTCGYVFTKYHENVRIV